MAQLLDDAQIQDGLSGLTDWQRDGDSITRTAKLASFPEAIEAVREVAVAAESADHHPDMDIRWRTVTFTCSTHSDGGITAKDLSLAAEIDKAIAAHS